MTEKETKETNRNGTLIGWLLLAVVFGIIGWVVYGGFNGFMAMAGLSLILSIVALIGLIPIVGIYLYFVWLGPDVISFVLSQTGYEHSLLTYIMYGFNGLLSVVVTVVVIIFIAAFISSR